MAESTVAYFKNDVGVKEIAVGAREFMCIGASTPFDHPHVFLDMGDDDEIVCPYCSTLFRFEEGMAPSEARPGECAHHEAGSG